MNYVSIQKLVEHGHVSIKTGPFGTQLKASEYVSHGTPVLNVRNLGFATVNTEKLEMIGAETLERLSAHKLMTGDIVFGRKGAVERHGFISTDENGWMQGSDCIRLRVLTDAVNPRFLSYYFLTRRHKAFMISMCSHGTTMASLNQKIIEKIEVPLPERAIQDDIVEILSVFDKRISTNQKINKNLEQQAQTLFHAWFVDYKPFGGVQPSDWKSIPVYDLAEYINGAAFKKHEYADTDKGLPIIKIAELKNGITESTQRCCVEKDPKYYIKDRDILFSWSGNPETSIDTFIWSMGDAILNQHTFRVVSKHEAPAFTFFLLKYLKPQFTHIASNKQTTGLGHVTVTDLKRLQFYTNRQVIKDFNDLTMPIFEMIYSNCKESQGLSMLRDSLLPKLMSGEIDVSELDL